MDGINTTGEEYNTVISCIGHLVCNNLFCNDFSTPFLLKRTIHLRISCI